MKKQINSKCYVKLFLIIMILFFLIAPTVFAAEPINVCMTSDFSGSNAANGIIQKSVIELIVKEVNEIGGIKGRSINLIIQDNGSDPAKAVGNAKMFKDQYKCNVILADVTSSVCLGLKKWAETNKIPMIASFPQSAQLIVENEKAWFFRTCAPATMNVETALSRIKKLGHTKIAFEGTTLAWGTDTLATIKRMAPKYGIQVVYEVLSDPKTKDMSIQSKKLQASGVQAMIVADYEAETAVLGRAMAAIGWKPYVMHTSAVDLNTAMRLADVKLFEDWEFMSVADESNPVAQKIWNKVEGFTGRKIPRDQKTLGAYDQINLLLEALKATPNLEDPTAIRDAFYHIDKNYARASGKRGSKGGFTTSHNALINIEDVVISTVKNGNVTIAK